MGASLTKRGDTGQSDKVDGLELIWMTQDGVVRNTSISLAIVAMQYAHPRAEEGAKVLGQFPKRP